ncbi:hypothetical protein G1H11_10505 [Phytoactinopolyspora alkaliphila]|uniref:Uncharacterized protein n=1 Tax=Phytoactinopolyspora alkaliphila TaxID=1783498 RepID=A0A6N9YL76_9ACTN|nr:hypothetical protein [Phytoactinopolyspora alkaliphila]NED95743.1 hypothetical protein [Phytoactinopolyspora alkaliphila]
MSSTVTAARDLFGDPAAVGDTWIEPKALLMSVTWLIAIAAVFLPLAIRRFHRLSR